MAPLQVIILLILVRLPALLAPTSPALQVPSIPNTHYPLPAWWVVSSFLLSHLLVILFIFLSARSAVRQLHQTSTSAASIAARFDRLLPFARWATILFTAVHLYLPGTGGRGSGVSIPHIVHDHLAATHLLKHIPLLPECLYIAPALLAWIAFWTAHYFVETAYRERSLAYRLAAQLPAHEMPSLGPYLSMQIRHNFYLLLPVLIVTLIEEATDRAQKFLPNAAAYGTTLTILVLLLMTPWLITRIWATVPLQGPLRIRLDALAHHYRLRFKNILIWKTHNAITNAAILG
jgi:hypothetical protein